MLSEDRFQTILQLLQQKRSVTVSELCKLLQTSESTIRRDLNTLAEMGKLNKVHGGATAIDQPIFTQEETVDIRSSKYIKEKNQIAAYAASIVTNEDFIFLDAGTTTEKVIDFLVPTKAVFITNGILHIRKLTQKGFRAYLLGGELKLSTEAMVGATAVENLKSYNFTKCFLGANGIHDKYGFTTPDVAEAMIKKEVLGRSFMRCILADRSKFGAITSVSFGNLSQACIVTDCLENTHYKDFTVIKEVGE